MKSILPGGNLAAEPEQGSDRTRRHWVAWLDIIQGASGLALLLFMWTHMLMVSSILISKDAMYMVARMFEGQYLFGEPYPVLVSLVALVIFILLVVHAVTALRKAPASYGEYRRFRVHAQRFKHPDTSLWMLQVVTGFMLMFLATVHIFQMFSQPAEIGPFASADRIWSESVWPLYLVLLFSVELHGGIGLYRMALKWGWFDLKRNRKRLKIAEWSITGFFLALGLLTLAAYIKIGMEHADRAGERYQPVAVAQQVEH